MNFIKIFTIHISHFSYKTRGDVEKDKKFSVVKTIKPRDRTT